LAVELCKSAVHGYFFDQKERKMQYPNLRYGNPNELRFYAQHIPIKELAKRLRRSERSVRDWLSEAERVPWWVPEILRLQHMEHCAMMRQMGMKPIMKKFGIVGATVIQFQSKTPGELPEKKISDCDHPPENQTHVELLQHG
jgi:hypothetical protein